MTHSNNQDRKRRRSRSRSRSCSRRRSRPNRYTVSSSSSSSLCPEQIPAKSDACSAQETTSPLVTQKTPLPALAHREELLRALKDHQVVICVGETGSGKTTQIPQFLDACGAYTDVNASPNEASSRCIAITQPRRVATVSVAGRVAEEMNTSVGLDGFVGYAIRFESKCSPHTRLKFVTDGVLVRECLSDPMLTKYSVVMLDEAHERSIHTDLLFGLLKQVMARRPEFRVLITSATLDATRFAHFFGATRSREDKKQKKKSTILPCPVVQIPGRVFPVEIFHSKERQIMGHRGPLSTYVRAAVETTLQIHNSEPPGHILVFLTGQREIQDACAQLEALAQEKPRHDMALRLFALYGALPGRKQREIFDAVPLDRVRKVIVATNIAETSLTIEGVRYVVDCGFTKQKVYDPVQQLEALVVVPISKVAAQQRAGRAGRTLSGKCYRLYNKRSYEDMSQATVPEIQRTNLANTVLYLKLVGIHDVLGFPYLDAPDEDALLDALKQLYVLGALDATTGEATRLGKLMAAFPLEPKLSRALIESVLLNCSHEMAQIVAMLSVENVFLDMAEKRPSEDPGNQQMDWERRMQVLREEGLLHPDGDFLTLRLVLAAFESQSHHVEGTYRELEKWCRARSLRFRALKMATSIVHQLRELLKTLSRRELDALQVTLEHRAIQGSPSVDDRLRRALCAGFFMNAARRCTLQTVYRLLSRNDKTPLVQMHPCSTMQDVGYPDYCLYRDLVVTSKPWMRCVVAVERRWLDVYTKDSNDVSTRELYALCGRPAPLEEGKEQEQGKKTTEAQAQALETVKPVSVTAEAVAAARARFLARSKR
ncbi:hypothetical protein PsorP6_018963 [Peronosclerospora sorghi]|nr:hypothetical protein PsorP6_018963 [Peronosclerospora sorghi]